VAKLLQKDGARRGDLLLTQDAYLAVEAGMRVPEGLEMGPFSIYPGLSNDVASSMHVVNPEMLKEIIESAGPDFAAFSGYGLVVGCPGVTELPIAVQQMLWEAVHSNYAELRSEKGFGQAYTTLRIMRKRGIRE
jgi:hypothetical protein